MSWGESPNDTASVVGPDERAVVNYYFACRQCGLVYLFCTVFDRPRDGRCRLCAGVLYDVPMLNYLASDRALEFLLKRAKGPEPLA
jgi:hypothetical protein